MTVSWKVIEGDCRDVLRSLPDRSVHTVVTSPPYFGLRSYTEDESTEKALEIGTEPSPDEFVQALVEVFREVRRVLRDDGTVWLNLGDSYCSTDKWGGGASGNTGKHVEHDGDVPSWAVRRRVDPIPGVKPKDLIGVPWMVAFALRADGWYLRQEIIWAKKNCMPESVTDRCTKSHEQIFLLSKRPTYHYDADAIREAHADSNESRPEALRTHGDGAAGEWVPGSAQEDDPHRSQLDHRGLPGVGTTFGKFNSAGRNKRSVWSVATQPYPGAHFAVFPPKLIEPCVLAGCPERCCAGCGAPWERVVERTPMREVLGDLMLQGGKSASTERPGDSRRGRTMSNSNRHDGAHAPEIRTLGFAPSCACDAGTTAGTVLDPFAGAGTSGVVALRLNRSFIGIELNPGYVEQARQRIRDDAPLMNTVSEIAT